MYYFTIKRPFWLVPSTEVVKEYDNIDKFMNLLEKSKVGIIIESVKYKDKNCKGRNGFNPYNMFAMIVYCFAFFKATLRDIEDKCKFDIRVMYIMEGEIPSYNTICEFINVYILPNRDEIFCLINKEIIKELELDVSDNYDDGTKIEANANKYKFVWKTTKKYQELDLKIKILLYDMGLENRFNLDKILKSYEVNKILKDYAEQNNIDINNIPSGRGKRLTKEQRYLKYGYTHLLKLLEYEEKIETCGENRNSYFKTDKDATAMVLKEDYYSKSSYDFHAAYNVQVIVSSLLIMTYGVFQDRSDHYTLIPMLDRYKKMYGYYPKNLCADAGYGIYINYEFIEQNKVGNYVKYQAWEGEANGKKPRLFHVDENNNVLCLNNKIGTPYKTDTHAKIPNSKFYKWTNCNDCNYSHKCKEFLKDKTKDYRTREISIDYELYKDKARNNLLSTKGIQIRVNRSIQVEGTFGQIKQNMNYDRIRRRGLKSVSCEIMLMCLGVNIRRYFYSIKNGKKFKNNCWNTPEDLQPEVFESVKPKEKKP